MYRGSRARASWTDCPGLICRKPLLGKAEDFTIYIKNFIRFPKFNFSKYVGLGSWGSRACLLVHCAWARVPGRVRHLHVNEPLGDAGARLPSAVGGAFCP